MGKKSKNPPKATAAPPQPPPSTTTMGYPSDGPSQEELNSIQTSNSSLQQKLITLMELATANHREEFVRQFVPLDLTPEEIARFLSDLTEGPEADGQWENLVAELGCIAAGRGVTKIEGDQVGNAVFFFQHPMYQGCDREVSFVCVGGEWRAEA